MCFKDRFVTLSKCNSQCSTGNNCNSHVLLLGSGLFRETLRPGSYTMPMSSEQARQQAQAERLTLLASTSSSGYFGVLHSLPGRPKPYQAQVCDREWQALRQQQYGFTASQQHEQWQ